MVMDEIVATTLSVAVHASESLDVRHTERRDAHKCQWAFKIRRGCCRGVRPHSGKNYIDITGLARKSTVFKHLHFG
jgi:hypothetical protein